MGSHPVTSSNGVKGAEWRVSEFPQSYSGEALVTQQLRSLVKPKWGTGFQCWLKMYPWDMITDQYMNERIVCSRS